MTPHGPALLWAREQSWAPTDWLIVPAWAAWLREVDSGRRDPDLDDALTEAAWWEVHATIAAACGDTGIAAFYLRTAHEVIREALGAAA